MSNINLDIKSIRENIGETRDSLDKYKTTVTSYLQRLENFDTSWNDASADSFVKTVAYDHDNFDSLIDTTKKGIDNVEVFCDDVQSTINRYLEVGTLNSIKYYQDAVTRSLGTLDQINEQISTAMQEVSTLVIPASSSCRSQISGLFNGVDTRVIAKTRSDINDAIRALEDSIERARSRSLQEGKYEMDSNTMRFEGRIIHPDLKRITEYKEKNYGYDKHIQRANLNEITSEGDTNSYGYDEHIKKVGLDNISSDNVTGDYSYNHGTISNNLNTANNVNIKNDYSYNNNVENPLLNSTDVAKQKEYSYNHGTTELGLFDNDFNNVTGDYSYNNEVHKNNLEDMTVENNATDYGYENHTRSNDLNSSTYEVSNDYDYNHETERFGIKEISQQKFTDYDYKNHNGVDNLSSEMVDNSNKQGIDTNLDI